MQTQFRIATGKKHPYGGQGDDIVEVMSIEYNVRTNEYWVRTHEELFYNTIPIQRIGTVMGVGHASDLSQALKNAADQHVKNRNLRYAQQK